VPCGDITVGGVAAEASATVSPSTEEAVHTGTFILLSFSYGYRFRF
jgi:hypothetical protein